MPDMSQSEDCKVAATEDRTALFRRRQSMALPFFNAPAALFATPCHDSLTDRCATWAPEDHFTIIHLAKDRRWLRLWELRLTPPVFGSSG